MAWLGFDMIQFILLNHNRQPVCSCRQQLEWPMCTELDDKPHYLIHLCPFPCRNHILSVTRQDGINKEILWQ